MRVVSDWLRGYKYLFKDTEAPQVFRQWAGLSVLAGATRRNIWLDFGFRHYPNMYVVLVGPPASRKTTAMLDGKRMLREAGPSIRFSFDSTSREALIDAMAAAYHGTLGYSALSAYSVEFSNMLQTSQAGMIDFLTGIYDYDREDYVHSTRGRGETKIVNPCLNLLACTQSDFINKTLPAYAIGSGFTSRVVFVYHEEPGKLVPRPKEEPWQKELKSALSADLKQIAHLQGEMRFTEAAGEWFDQWYLSRKAEITSADKRLAGYMGRKPLHVLKTAMMLSVSQRNDLVLMPEDLQRAVRMVESLEPGLRRLFCAVGRNVFAPVTHRILEQLVNAKKEGEAGITMADLLMRNLGDVDYEELKRTVSTIYMMGLAVPIQTGVQKALDVVAAITPKGEEYIKGNWSAEGEALEDTMLFAKEQ